MVAARPPRSPTNPAAATAAPKRWRQGPVNIGSLTTRLARPALGKRGFAGAEILTHWPAIVGTDLAAFACPLEVKYPRGRKAGATLHLRVASGAAATMLQMKLPAVIARINRFFGYDAVVQVQAHQGTMPPAKAGRRKPEADDAKAALDAPAETRIADQVAGIASEPLRQALVKLGRTLQFRSRAPRDE